MSRANTAASDAIGAITWLRVNGYVLVKTLRKFVATFSTRQVIVDIVFNRKLHVIFLHYVALKSITLTKTNIM